MRFLLFIVFFISPLGHAQPSIKPWKCITTSSIGAKMSDVTRPLVFQGKSEYRIVTVKKALDGLRDDGGRHALQSRLSGFSDHAENIALIREVTRDPASHISWSMCNVKQMPAYSAPTNQAIPLLSYDTHEIYQCFIDKSFVLNSGSSRFSRVSAGGWTDQGLYFDSAYTTTDPYLDFGICQPYYD